MISPPSSLETNSRQGVSDSATHSRDRRGSPFPTRAMIATRFMELRRRRGLMIALIAVDIGIPVVFLTVRLIAHAIAPRTFGPAGGYGTFTGMVNGALFVLGFIVAATAGCTAGSADLTEGVFRHLVVTGRSRVALYLARIPAGLAIVVPLVAVGFTIVCSVCVFAAPSKLDYQGVTVPAGLSRTAFVSWAADHPDLVYCEFPYRGQMPIDLPCGPNNQIIWGHTVSGSSSPTRAQLRALVIKIAEQNYSQYAMTFLSPPRSLMVETGLWVELEAVIGFVVGLGLASLMGQRTVPVVLLIVFQVMLSPLLARPAIPHAINLQRAMIGLAMEHIEPNGLPLVFSGMRGGGFVTSLPPESTFLAVCVIVAWLVGWTLLGGWRMTTRDA
jgi:hypothetical protein